MELDTEMFQECQLTVEEGVINEDDVQKITNLGFKVNSFPSHISIERASTTIADICNLSDLLQARKNQHESSYGFVMVPKFGEKRYEQQTGTSLPGNVKSLNSSRGSRKLLSDGISHKQPHSTGSKGCSEQSAKATLEVDDEEAADLQDLRNWESPCDTSTDQMISTDNEDTEMLMHRFSKLNLSDKELIDEQDADLNNDTKGKISLISKKVPIQSAMDTGSRSRKKAANSLLNQRRQNSPSALQDEFNFLESAANEEKHETEPQANYDTGGKSGFKNDDESSDIHSKNLTVTARHQICQDDKGTKGTCHNKENTLNCTQRSSSTCPVQSEKKGVYPEKLKPDAQRLQMEPHDKDTVHINQTQANAQAKNERRLNSEDNQGSESEQRHLPITQETLRSSDGVTREVFQENSSESALNKQALQARGQQENPTFISRKLPKGDSIIKRNGIQNDKMDRKEEESHATHVNTRRQSSEHAGDDNRSTDVGAEGLNIDFKEEKDQTVDAGFDKHSFDQEGKENQSTDTGTGRYTRCYEEGNNQITQACFHKESVNHTENESESTDLGTALHGPNIDKMRGQTTNSDSGRQSVDHVGDVSECINMIDEVHTRFDEREVNQTMDGVTDKQFVDHAGNKGQHSGMAIGGHNKFNEESQDQLTKRQSKHYPDKESQGNPSVKASCHQEPNSNQPVFVKRGKGTDRLYSELENLEDLDAALCSCDCGQLAGTNTKKIEHSQWDSQMSKHEHTVVQSSQAHGIQRDLSEGRQISGDCATFQENVQGVSYMHRSASYDGKSRGSTSSRAHNVDETSGIMRHPERSATNVQKFVQDSKCKDTEGKTTGEEYKLGKTVSSLHTSDNDSSNSELDDDSSSSESEICFVMKDWEFHLAQEYYENSKNYQLFFAQAKPDDGRYRFSLIGGVKSEKFLKELKNLGFGQIHLTTQNQSRAESVVKQVKPPTKAIIHDGTIFLVSPSSEFQSAKMDILSKLTSEYSLNTRQIPGTPGGASGRVDANESYGKNTSSSFSDDGARPKVRQSLSSDETSRSYHNPSSRQKPHDSDEEAYRPEGYRNQRGRMDGPPAYQGQHSGLRIQIYKTDITKLNVDCIVNAANSRLKHRGGVAKAIAAAAGEKLQNECRKYIDSGKTVAVTDVFQSSGGNLPAKCVLHAVGPKWDLYPDTWSDKQQCTDDLRRTILRCLVEAGRLGLRSVALPSISAAIFKVPKKFCAKSYMDAVKHFDVFNAEQFSSPLRDIHFVDVDDTMVNIIQECFLSNWSKSSDPEIAKKDFEFCHTHLRSKIPLPSRNASAEISQQHRSQLGQGGTSRKVSSSTSSQSGTVDTSYQLQKIQLRVSCRPALDLRADLIVVVGAAFDRLSGLPQFHAKSFLKPCYDKPYEKNAYRFCDLTKPDGTSSRLLCLLKADPEHLDSSFGCLESAIKNLRISSKEPKVLENVTITSTFLYAEESKAQQGKQKKLDNKIVGNFARLVYEHLDKISKNPMCTLKRVVVAASRDAVASICRVFESRDLKRISNLTPASGSYIGSDHQKREQFPAQQTGYAASAISGKSQSRERTTSSPPRSTPETQRQSREADANLSSERASKQGTSVDKKRECQICSYEKSSTMPLPCCKNLICEACEQRMPSCPFCQKSWRVRTGDQPDGFMTVKLLKYQHADGYENCPVWEIEYNFPSGTQKDFHPNPNRMYYSTKRTAYIPASDHGLLVLKLLRLAFTRRLTFTIGTSRTTSREDVITWNDIHHKTSLHGGTYGYPDGNYLLRVMHELADKGVTLESMTEQENVALASFEKILTTRNQFSD